MYPLNQYPIYSAGIPGFRNQGVEMGVAPLTKTLNDPLENFLLSSLVTLISAGLKVSVSKGGMVPHGNTTMIPLK